MEYRLANLSDVDGICELIGKAIDEMESHGIHQWDDLYPAREDFINDIENESLYVITEDEQYAAIYVISGESDEEYKFAAWTYPDETSFILHRFCVSPDFQNRGLGKTILLHIEEQLKGMGYESVRLDVFTENPFALKLYRNNGYVERGYADWRMGRFELMEKVLV